MSTRTLPILFLNLGGEMLYILDQRLRAQSIPYEKAKKGKNEKYNTVDNVLLSFIVLNIDYFSFK